MRRILMTIVFGSAFIAGLGAVYLWQNEIRQIEPLISDVPADIADENGESAASADDSLKEQLKAQALKIIDKPVVFKANMPEASKNQARQKIEEAVRMIREDYDYDAPWLELGAYRKLIGDYEGAIEAWNFLALIRPQNFVAFHNIGDVYGFYLRDYKKAEENFLKSIYNNTANIDAYSQLVTIYGITGESDKIENVLTSGIKFNPSNPLLKILLGEYYVRQGEKDKGLVYLEDALKLDPKNTALAEEIAGLKGR